MDLDDDDNENKVEQSITIEASAQDCFTAATTYEDYPKWAGCTKAVKVLERRASDGLAVLVEFVSPPVPHRSIPPHEFAKVMGIFGFTSRNKMKYTYDKPRCMRLCSVGILCLRCNMQRPSVGTSRREGSKSLMEGMISSRSVRREQRLYTS